MTSPKSSPADWPGWQRDMELTSIYAKRIRKALKAAINTRKLAEAWIALHPRGAARRPRKPGLGPLRARANEAIQDALRDVLPDAATEGWALGQQAAIASSTSLLGPIGSIPDVDWGEWTPGDVEAAYQVAGTGLRDLLSSQEVTIKSIASSRLEELGDVLAEYLSSPEVIRPADLSEPVPPMYSADALADALEGVLDDPSRATMVAQTEIARAQSQAAQWVFQGLGVGMVQVSTAGDSRVCPVCASAESAGPQAIGTYTVPFHPMCRCALIAALPPHDSASVAARGGRVADARAGRRIVEPRLPLRRVCDVAAKPALVGVTPRGRRGHHVGVRSPPGRGLRADAARPRGHQAVGQGRAQGAGVC